MFGFWLAVVVVVLGFVIMAAELGWPRRAGRRADSAWRVDGSSGGFTLYSQYYAVAPRWYRFLTEFWHGWRWVRL